MSEKKCPRCGRPIATTYPEVAAFLKYCTGDTRCLQIERDALKAENERPHQFYTDTRYLLGTGHRQVYAAAKSNDGWYIGWITDDGHDGVSGVRFAEAIHAAAEKLRKDVT